MEDYWSKILEGSLKKYRKSKIKNKKKLYEDTKNIKELIAKHDLKNKFGKYLSSKFENLNYPGRIRSFFGVGYRGYKKMWCFSEEEIEEILEREGYSIKDINEIVYSLYEELKYDPISEFHKLAPSGSYNGIKFSDIYNSLVNIAEKKGENKKIFGENVIETSINELSKDILRKYYTLRILYNNGNIGLAPYKRRSKKFPEFYYLSTKYSIL
jgi:hypothetical protein